MYLRIIGIAILCSGCAELLGIEETSSVPNRSNAVRLQRVSVGASVEFNPLDVGTPTPSFFVADTSDPSGIQKIPTTTAEAGRWIATTRKPIDGVIYSFSDSPIPHLLSYPGFAGSDLRAYVNLYEHANPKPAASPGPTVMINVTLPTTYQPTESFAVDAVGAWSHFSVPPPAVGAPALANTSSYSMFKPFDGIGGSLWQLTAQDVFALLRYDTVTGITKLTGHRVVPVDSTNNTIAVTGIVTPLPTDQNQNLSANITPALVANRFATTMPASPPPAQSWRIDAAPGYALGLPFGFMLATGPVAQNAATITAMYTNPFSTQWHPTINYIAVSQRTFSMGANSTNMTTALQTVAEAAPSLTLEMAAGLPTKTTLNNMPLNVDGITLSLDVAGPVFVDITTDRTQNTLYEVTVVEVAVAGAQITRKPVAVTSGVDTHLPLPPGVLQAGHTYYLQVLCTAGGYTQAATGDLQTFALPVSRALQEGAVFTIAAS